MRTEEEEKQSHNKNTDGSNGNVNLSQEQEDQLIRQFEFYFSDSNFYHDQYLRNLIDKGKGGYVPVNVFLNFNRVKNITTNLALIKKAISKSDHLQLNKIKTKVRRRTPFNRDYNPDPSTVYVEPLPSDIDTEQFRRAMAEYGTVVYLSIPRAADQAKGFAFVEYADTEAASKALQALPWDRNFHQNNNNNNNSLKKKISNNNNKNISCKMSSKESNFLDNLRALSKESWLMRTREYQRLYRRLNQLRHQRLQGKWAPTLSSVSNNGKGRTHERKGPSDHDKDRTTTMTMRRYGQEVSFSPGCVLHVSGPNITEIPLRTMLAGLHSLSPFVVRIDYHRLNKQSGAVDVRFRTPEAARTVRDLVSGGYTDIFGDVNGCDILAGRKEWKYWMTTGHLSDQHLPSEHTGKNEPSHRDDDNTTTNDDSPPDKYPCEHADENIQSASSASVGQKRPRHIVFGSDDDSSDDDRDDEHSGNTDHEKSNTTTTNIEKNRHKVSKKPKKKSKKRKRRKKNN